MDVQVLILLLVAIVAARIAWRRGARPWAFGFAVFALLPFLSLLKTTHPLLLTAIGSAAVGWVWQRRGSTFTTVTRWGASSRRKAGVASSLDIARSAGVLAMRRQAPIVRPSLTPPNIRARIAQLLSLSPTEVAVQLCRVGRQRVFCSSEDVIVLVGVPRQGKTQELAGQIVDAPGAVLVTSTRTDVLEQTGPARAQKGPVYVFNPIGLGLLKSSITFDPLTGCESPVTAAERAADMIGAGSQDTSGDRKFWDELARMNLAALMHAAALGELTMAEVQQWVSNPRKHEPLIVSLLSESPEPAFEAAIAQFINTNERTQSSITMTISPALAWLTHGPARAAALPVAKGGHPFDVADLLATKASVYMLGGTEAQVAPLVAALTGHIARQARDLAVRQPGGRLDPPLSLRLDEAALICPIPLHEWSADMGGRGVSIVACFQSRAQILDTYGPAKTATILNNAGGKVLFGGTGDRDDLQFWSTLAGERDEPVVTTDMNGRVASRTTRRVPVLSPAQLSQMTGRVVVYRRNLPPVIGRPQLAYKRMDLRLIHQPNVLTVRFYRWRKGLRVAVTDRMQAVAAAAARWLRPATTRIAHWAGQIRAGFARRWAALRLRVTGIDPRLDTDQLGNPGRAIESRPSLPPQPGQPSWLTIPKIAPPSRPPALPPIDGEVIDLDAHRDDDNRNGDGDRRDDGGPAATERGA